jgi:NADH-dependent peroxiredoxin subunit F
MTTNTKIYDLIIIGGGPAGCAAAVYAARKRLRTMLIVKDWGGQSVVSDDIQNWIGTNHISGSKLANSLKNHVLEYTSQGNTLELTTGLNVINSKVNNNTIEMMLENNNTLLAKSILITTGSSRKKLLVPGAESLEHKGLTYCATCDGPLYSGTDVVVVGGGNAGFESAAQLLAYCKSVTLLSRSEARAEKITIDKLKQNQNFTLIENVTPVEVYGSPMLSGIKYELLNTENNSKEIIDLPCSGVFVEIGQDPNTDWCKDIVELDEYKKIKIDPWTQKTNTKNIWAAGDVTNILYHQNNIAAGDAVRAIEDIYKTIHS